MFNQNNQQSATSSSSSSSSNSSSSKLAVEFSPARPVEQAVLQDHLRCPILQEKMRDPVIAADGYTYEREAITQWIATRGARALSPMTGERLVHLELQDNILVRQMISSYQDTKPQRQQRALTAKDIELACQLREEELRAMLEKQGRIIETMEQQRDAVVQQLEPQQRKIKELTQENERLRKMRNLPEDKMFLKLHSEIDILEKQLEKHQQGWSASIIQLQYHRRHLKQMMRDRWLHKETESLLHKKQAIEKMLVTEQSALGTKLAELATKQQWIEIAKKSQLAEAAKQEHLLAIKNLEQPLEGLEKNKITKREKIIKRVTRFSQTVEAKEKCTAAVKDVLQSQQQAIFQFGTYVSKREKEMFKFFESRELLPQEYDLFLMSDLPKNGRPEKRKMYLEETGVGLKSIRLRYIVETSKGNVVEDFLNIDMPELTQKSLALHKFTILTETSKRGHTLSQPIQKSIALPSSSISSSFSLSPIITPLSALKTADSLSAAQIELQNQLTKACYDVDIEKVKELVEKKGADPAIPDQDGQQPLAVAIWGLALKVIDYLESKVKYTERDWQTIARNLQRQHNILLPASTRIVTIDDWVKHQQSREAGWFYNYKACLARANDTVRLQWSEREHVNSVRKVGNPPGWYICSNGDPYRYNFHTDGSRQYKWLEMLLKTMANRLSEHGIMFDANYQFKAKGLLLFQPPQKSTAILSSSSSLPSSASPAIIPLSALKTGFAVQIKLQNQLTKACYDADVDKVKELVEQGADPANTDQDEQQPLAVAIWGLAFKVIDYLESKVKYTEQDWQTVASNLQQRHQKLLPTFMRIDNDREWSSHYGSKMADWFYNYKQCAIRAYPSSERLSWNEIEHVTGVTMLMKKYPAADAGSSYKALQIGGREYSYDLTKGKKQRKWMEMMLEKMANRLSEHGIMCDANYEVGSTETNHVKTLNASGCTHS